MGTSQRVRRLPTFGEEIAGSDLPPGSALGNQSDTMTHEPLAADLLADFPVQGGAGLYPPLSVLALEIVLNEIVAQACLATGATGAAILLGRDGGMVCRASSGSTAPEAGDRHDSSFKLYAECVRTRHTQRCDDILAEPQGEVEALRGLDVRSIILLPLLQDAELVGVFELLSSKSSAFEEREERILQELGGRTMNKLRQATESLEAQREAGMIPEPEAERPKEIDGRVLRYIRSITLALAAVVLVCLLLFGVLIAKHFGAQKTAVHTSSTAAPATAEQAPLAVVSSGEQEHFDSAVKVAPLAKPSAGKPVPPGGLAVFENGKEVFRLPPGNNQDQPAAAEQKSETPAKQ